MKVALITLGCKVSQYETEVLKEAFETLGYETTTKLVRADIYVLNTCAVTNEAERKSRQMIGKFIKLNPDAKIFVCGCASQNNPQQFSDMPSVQYVCGNANKLSILDNLEIKNVNVSPFCEYYEDMTIKSSSKTRAYVKIQDGCNRFCSYCLIPYLRGRSRSRDIVSILKEVDALAKAGTQEIVITGIDVSDFKIDNKPGLLQLLTLLDKYNINIRLSSVEPNQLTTDFLIGLSLLKNFCPHFHISMQSGSSSVLKRMNRRYSSQFFIEKVTAIYNIFDNPSVTTDVIVGFPGETDEDFEQTMDLVRQVEYNAAFTFLYSIRKGTPAEKYEDQVPEEVKHERFDRLVALIHEIQGKKSRQHQDKIVRVLVEGRSQRNSETYAGHADFGLTVNFNGTPDLVGKLVEVKVTEAKTFSLWGDVVRVIR